MPDGSARSGGGGRADEFNAPIAYVNKDGDVNVNRNHRDNDNRENRFRPAELNRKSSSFESCFYGSGLVAIS